MTRTRLIRIFLWCSLLGFLAPAFAFSPVTLGSLYWNPAEAGRGFAIQRNAAGVTFAVMFAYDQSGHATWWYMPNGQPIAPNVVEGEVYHPTGPSYTLPVFDPGLVNIGPPVGRFHIEWRDNVHATFTFDVQGVHGSTAVLPFLYALDGGASTVILWNPKESGWGFAKYYGILPDPTTHEFPWAYTNTDFAIWFTYDEKGATWFVASDSQRLNAFDDWDIESTAYHYTGPPLAPVFDAAQVRGERVGSFIHHVYRSEFYYTIDNVTRNKSNLKVFTF